MRRMMEGVVLKPYGTGHKYCPDSGYTSAGKTGSPQIYDYDASNIVYNASFMGFAPVTNPAIVVVVTISGTEGNAVLEDPPRVPPSVKLPLPPCACWMCRKICRDMPPSPDTDPVR